MGAAMQPVAPPGHEGVGIVTRVGRDVTDLEAGDRVAGGGFQTLHNANPAHLHKIPESKLPDEMWIVEPVSCAITGIDHCRLKPGDRVVLIGCGFMGLLILQGLARSFAEQIVVIDIVPNRLDLAKSLGFDETYNASTGDPAAFCKDLAARNIDVVIDTTGHPSGLDMSTEIVRPGGLINLFGWIKGETTINTSAWHTKGITVVNSSPSAALRDPFGPAIRMIHQGLFDLAPLVSHVVPLDGYPDLMMRILDGDSSYVKGVVTLS